MTKPRDNNMTAGRDPADLPLGDPPKAGFDADSGYQTPEPPARRGRGKAGRRRRNFAAEVISAHARMDAAKEYLEEIKESDDPAMMRRFVGLALRKLGAEQAVATVTDSRD